MLRFVFKMIIMIAFYFLKRHVSAIKWADFFGLKNQSHKVLKDKWRKRQTLNPSHVFFGFHVIVLTRGSFVVSRFEVVHKCGARADMYGRTFILLSGCWVLLLWLDFQGQAFRAILESKWWFCFRSCWSFYYAFYAREVGIRDFSVVQSAFKCINY